MMEEKSEEKRVFTESARVDRIGSGGCCRWK